MPKVLIASQACTDVLEQRTKIAAAYEKEAPNIFSITEIWLGQAKCDAMLGLPREAFTMIAAMLILEIEKMDRRVGVCASASLEKLGASERKCIEVLGAADDECFLCFRSIEIDGRLSRTQVKRAVRSLARKGLAEYRRGLFNDDGAVAGSGYRLTKEGRSLVSTIEEVT